MDRKNVKDLIIKSLWDDTHKNKASKTGDEYRSLSKQIDNFLDLIETKDPVFDFFPFDKLSDKDIVKFGISFVNKPNRKIIDNIRNRRSTANAKDILTNASTRESDYQKLKEYLKKEYGTDSDRSLAYIIDYNCISAIKSGRNNNILSAVNRAEYYFDVYCDTLIDYFDEFADQVGHNVEFEYYLENAIYTACRIVTESLLNFVLYNNNVKDKHRTLNSINNSVESFEEIIMEKVNSLRNQRLKEYSKNSTSGIDDFTELFALHIQRDVWCNEFEDIAKILWKEICNKPDFFKPCDTKYSHFYTQPAEHDPREEAKAKEILRELFSQPIKLDIYNNRRDYDKKIDEITTSVAQKLRNSPDFDLNAFSSSKNSTEMKNRVNALEVYITEGEKINDFDRKFEYASKLVDYLEDMDKENHFKHIRAAFREIYKNDTQYKRNQTQSILKRFLHEDKLEIGQFEFLAVKYIRGIFREDNLIEYFEEFYRIIVAIYRLFSSSYYTLGYSYTIKVIRELLFAYLTAFKNLDSPELDTE